MIHPLSLAGGGLGRRGGRPGAGHEDFEEPGTFASKTVEPAARRFSR